MDSIALLQQALQEDPGDDGAWFALADALEEQGDPSAEATRLSVWLRRRLDDPAHSKWEERLRALLKAGVRVPLPRMTIPLSKIVGMELLLIPPGSFWMGSPESEAGRRENEKQHRVTLSKGFWLGIHPVTQGQWEAVRGKNPSHFKGAKRPVESVSWQDCQAFCEERSAQRGKSLGLRFQLPTEAQWEYACRAGTTTPFGFGATISTREVNYNGNYPYGEGKKGEYRQQTTEVGSFPANAWGLADMHGNVWEWCHDWYDDNYDAANEDIRDPQGPQSGTGRVLRGGSRDVGAWNCRAACRHSGDPGLRGYDYIGFRVVLAPA